MSVTKRKSDFNLSEAGVNARQILVRMISDDGYITEPSFSANAVLYPDNLIPFVDKHMDFLRDHPTTDPMLYLSNLRLMTRVR